MVAADLAKGDGAGAVAVGFPHGGGGGLAGRPGGDTLLGGELLPGGLTPGGFACCLLCPGHDYDCCVAMDDSLDEVRRYAGVASSSRVVVAALLLCVDVLLAGSPNSLSPANSGLTSEKR